MKQLILCDSIFRSLKDENSSISGYLIIDEGKIQTIAEGFPSQEALRQADELFDFRGKTLTAGLVDAHTHLVFGGSREKELAMKLAGKSYMEIHRAGGGIKSTMKATRAADDEELRTKTLGTLRSMLLHGTTTVEAKSGYGLDRDTELRVLRLMARLRREQPLDIVSTYMGAHDVPPEFDSAGAYADFIIETMIPLVRQENLAEFFDIFCEEGIFDLEVSERLGRAALKAGFALKMHVDEIASMGGAGLAADLGATSCEHLMAVRDEDIPKLAKSGTVAVLLPATSYFLMAERYAPARKMLDAGVHVAIASDYNPGSSPCENLQMAMYNACYMMKLEPSDILRGVTIEAARALGREKEIGSLEPGKKANLTVFDEKNIDALFYHFGMNHVSDVFIEGKRVVKDRALQPFELRH